MSEQEMKSQAMNTILGIAGVVVALSLIAAAVLWMTRREDAVTGIRPTSMALDVRLPPIDAAAPSKVATATFALG